MDFCHADLQRAHIKPYVRAVDYDAHERKLEHEYRSVLIYSINGNQQFMSKMDIENFCKYDAFLFARRDESEVAQKYSTAALKLSIAVGMMTAAIFCLLSEGRQLHMRPSKNLFAPVKFSDIPIGKILRAGSAVTFGKIYVAVFASLQIAIRICRTVSAMTLQVITPILPMIIFLAVLIVGAKILQRKGTLLPKIFGCQSARPWRICANGLNGGERQCFSDEQRHDNGYFARRRRNFHEQRLYQCADSKQLQRKRGK